MTMHGRAGEYLEGALSAADEDAFLDHVTDCAACQAELHGEVQLRDREDALRAAAPPIVEAAPRADVVPIDRARRRRTWIMGATALAAAALAIVVLRPKPHATTPAAPRFALADKRSIEPRLVWPPAAGHRAYDAMRGTAAAPRETFDPHAIAALSDAHDCGGLAAAYVLSNELERAAQQYAACGPGADLDAERAGLAVLRHDPAAALALADRALAIAPEHAVALWNRALALRDLGLGLASAAAFDQVAAREADPAWAAEATRRAADVRAPLEEMRDGIAPINAAGRAMIAGGPPIPDALARRYPGRARLRLAVAVLAATTPERLVALRPLAVALDGVDGAGLLAWFDAATPSRAPAPVVARFASWGGDPDATDAASWKRWLADARAAHADALVLAAIMLSVRFAEAPPGLDVHALDPWTASMYEAMSLRADPGPRTDARLDELAAGCAAGSLGAAPCMLIAREQTTRAFERYRPAASAAAAAEMLRLATSLGEWGQRPIALFYAASAARMRGEVALLTALFDEYAREQGDCESRRLAIAVTAEFLLDADRVDDAHRLLATRPTCATPRDLVELGVEADLARQGLALRPVDELIADLSSAPDEPPGYRAYYVARTQLATADAAAAGARLRALAVARDAPSAGPGRTPVATLAAATLAIEAGRASRWPDVVEIVGAWLGVAAPARCALIAASEDARTVLVAIDGAGVPVGSFERGRRVDGGAPLPAAITRALATCAAVDVLATPPWLGADLGLPPALPWRFVTRAARAAADGPVRRVIVADPHPPTSLGLAPLGVHVGAPAGAELLRGDAATVARLAAAARDATVVEIHAHTAPVDGSDAPALALSPAAGGWAASAELVSTWSLARAPVVLLADCDAGRSAGYENLAWGLPRAFLGAGARAVIAALVPVPDAEADEVFAALGDAIAAGVDPATAVARVRAEKIARDPSSWLRHVVVFE